MYLGFIFLQLSLGILLSMVHIMLMCIFTYIIFKYYVIKPEEKYLSSKFGETIMIINPRSEDGYNILIYLM
ncbi:MAG: hypothetical protein Ct9H90mP18_05690 [Gammaproteobacteria bacterium]|nr:MAG: hypothetical protein Ct9H90mP18_05690 [Gammaproteobacteria bacterium]